MLHLAKDKKEKYAMNMDSTLAKYPSDVITDINDQYGEVISDYEIDYNIGTIEIEWNTDDGKIKDGIIHIFRKDKYLK